MKKVQRSYVVEYKSGRRNTDAKSSSIWGNIDFKTVARNLLKDEAPFLTPQNQSDTVDVEVSSPKANSRRSELTQSIRRPTTLANTPEITMADEDEMTTNVETPIHAAAVIDTPTKQRKPRAKKSALETTSLEVAAGATLGKKTRGRKSKVNGDATSIVNASVLRGRKTAQGKTEAPSVAIDDMTDLLQLDEENKRLRKLLAEKLRAENADLRERLGFG